MTCATASRAPRDWVRGGVQLLLLLSCLCARGVCGTFWEDRWKTGTFKCTGTHPQSRSCLLQNVYFWKGTVYFFTKGNVDTAAPPDLEIQLPASDRPVNPIRTMRVADGFKFLPPGYETVVGKGLLWHRSRPLNMYHQLWEILPTIHLLVCQYFKKCSHDPRDKLQLFFVDQYSTKSYPAFHEAVRCLSAVPYWETSTGDHRVYFIKQLVVGTGAKIYGRHGAWIGPNRRYAPAEDYVSYHARMKACVGLPILKPVELIRPPVVSILQRSFDGRGRFLTNLDEVRPSLELLAPHFKWQVVSLNANMSFAQQAHVFAATSILVSPHGAQLAHMMWMPKGAIIVEIDQYGLEDEPMYMNLAELLGPHLDLKHVRYTPRQLESALVRKDAVAKLPAFKKQHWATAQQFASFPRCDFWFPNGEVGNHCIVWLMYYCDIKLEVDNLKQTVTKALGMLPRSSQTMQRPT